MGFCVPISGRISLVFHQREPREAREPRENREPRGERGEGRGPRRDDSRAPMEAGEIGIPGGIPGTPSQAIGLGQRRVRGNRAGGNRFAR